MPAADVELENEDTVIRWRRDELERAGYDRAAAKEIAERVEVDLHFATDLLRQGCPQDTALKILL